MRFGSNLSFRENQRSASRSERRIDQIKSARRNINNNYNYIEGIDSALNLQIETSSYR